MQNKQKLDNTRKTVRDLESKTSLTRGEILIKLIFLEMTPEQIVEENRLMEEANWYDCTDILQGAI